MRYREDISGGNFSGSFSGYSPERVRKVVNPGASKSGSAIEDLKRICGKKITGFKKIRKEK